MCPPPVRIGLKENEVRMNIILKGCKGGTRMGVVGDYSQNRKLKKNHINITVSIDLNDIHRKPILLIPLQNLLKLNNSTCNKKTFR